MTESKAAAAQPSATNRDITDRLLYPLLLRLVVFIPPSVHPNTITLAALGSALAAAAALAFWSSPFALLACAAGLVGWVLLDACDGIHARNTGQCSKFGSFLDHFGDATGFFFLQAAIIYRFDIHEPVVFGAMLLRQVMVCWTYIIQVYAGHLYIASLGWSFEIYAYATLMVATFLVPALRFQVGFFPRLDLLGNAMLIYYVAVPLTLLEIGMAIYSAQKKALRDSKQEN